MITTGGYTWVFDDDAVDWVELSELYRVAPSVRSPRTTFGSCSPTACSSVSSTPRGGWSPWAGPADGLDCVYIADVAVHPDPQGVGIGRILYANPAKEGFSTRLGFLRMRTAMAIWRNRDR